MTVVLFTNDLMFQSRIASVVRNAGNSLIVVRNLDALQSRLAADTPLTLAVFDLSLRELDLGGAVEFLRSHYPSTKLLAYGAHVDVDALQRASDLGIDEVMTRGQFDRQMAMVLAISDPNSSH